MQIYWAWYSLHANEKSCGFCNVDGRSQWWRKVVNSSTLSRMRRLFIEAFWPWYFFRLSAVDKHELFNGTSDRTVTIIRRPKSFEHSGFDLNPHENV